MPINCGWRLRTSHINRFTCGHRKKEVVPEVPKRGGSGVGLGEEMHELVARIFDRMVQLVLHLDGLAVAQRGDDARVEEPEGAARGLSGEGHVGAPPGQVRDAERQNQPAEREAPALLLGQQRQVQRDAVQRDAVEERQADRGEGLVGERLRVHVHLDEQVLVAVVGEAAQRQRVRRKARRQQLGAVELAVLRLADVLAERRQRRVLLVARRGGERDGAALHGPRDGGVVELGEGGDHPRGQPEADDRVELDALGGGKGGWGGGGSRCG